jgi:long-subunit acyl-CoA synthetase (AMP-forming)
VIDEAYGLTEVGLVTVSPPSGRVKLGSVGQVVPAVSLSIRNDDGEELSAGIEGRWLRLLVQRGADGEGDDDSSGACGQEGEDDAAT